MPQAPTGGEKDTQAPQLLSSSIPNQSINSRPKKIEFHFDEHLAQTNLKSEIIISPSLGSSVTYKHAKKKITIELPSDSLLSNTTYNIQFKGAIKDLNENNVLEIQPFSFSTGDQLDTTSISGNVLLLEPKEKTKFYIATNSNIKRGQFTTTEKATFTLHNTPANTENLYAFLDNNNNSLYDPSEPLGIQKNGIDSNEIIIYNITKKNIYYSNDSSFTYLTGLNNNLTQILKLSQYSSKDTLIISNKDTQKLFDIIKFNNIKILKTTTNYSNSIYYKLDNEENSEDSTITYNITFNSAIKSINTDSIQSTKLLNKQGVKITFTNNHLQITIPNKLKENNSILLKNKSVQFYNNIELKNKIELNYKNNNTRKLLLENKKNKKIIVLITNKSNFRKYVIINSQSSATLDLANDNYNLYYSIQNTNLPKIDLDINPFIPFRKNIQLHPTLLQTIIIE